jgi:hypothetical protein
VYFPPVCRFFRPRLLEQGEWALADLHLVGLRLVDLRLVDLRLVGRMVLLAVLHRCTFLVRASLLPVVVSIQMERELSCRYLLHSVDLVDRGLLLDIAPRRRHLRDP